MPNHVSGTSEIIKLLPQPFKIRFNSLGNYVKAVVDDEKKKKRESALTEEDIRLIQLAAFIYSLNFFLREGSEAAQAAAQTLEQFGVEGFKVGSTIFTKDNENTLLGKKLAEELMKSLADTPLAKHIEQATSMTHLIKSLRDEIIDEREAMD